MEGATAVLALWGATVWLASDRTPCGPTVKEVEVEEQGRMRDAAPFCRKEGKKLP